MNLHATQPTENSAPAPGAARFAFASGARPLDGYTIKRGVGHGGFGEVYYAVSDAGKEVALKLVRRNLDIELRGVTQCLNLKHPNLVSLFDIRQDDQGETWVVMEYVSGQCLQEVLASHPSGLPVEQVMQWMQGIGAGVAYLHDHGIVHRDLKPGNVFCEDGTVKIGDYGLSKFISCSRRSGQTGSVGTVHYMAPEVANGRYGKEVDIYALGIVLYEMITGHVPFDGESLGEVLMKHLTAQPDLSMIAEPYRTAIARALAKDPEQRVRSVGDLMALLPRSGGGYADPQRCAVLPPTLVAAGGVKTGSPIAIGLPVAGVPVAAAPVAAAVHPADGPAVAAAFHNGAVDDPPIRAEVIPPAGNEEPLWRLVRTTWFDVRRWWDRSNLLAWQRLIILIAALVLLLKTALIWLPTLAVLSVFYGVYWVVWALAFKKQRRAASNIQPGAGSAAPPIAMNPKTWGRGGPTFQRWQNGGTSLPPLTGRQRATELVGSMFAGAIVAIFVALVMFLVRGGIHGPSVQSNLNQYAWLALSAIVGAWGVLIPAKLWQGSREDTTLRRFVMLAVGLLLGAAAYGVQTGLLVHLPYEMNRHLPWPISAGHLFIPSMANEGQWQDAYGAPSVYSFLTYFGFLFFVLRWWRQADPLRRSRLRIWSVAVTVFWAGVANTLWPLPQPWGLMLAATISIAVQMAGVWIPPRDRGRIEWQATGGK
ncbi:MAG TPA: serine/threonine-protein kinase [Pirellulales bacterium]|nr:serine/threonine-protein kinase [Pirellulales bacterium]